MEDLKMKKTTTDEPIVLQILDTMQGPWSEESFLKLKLGCDKLDGGRGEFGRSITNPIPVNHVRGEVFYLNRLRTKDGKPLKFRRVCSRPGPAAETPVDEYEVFTADGQVKAVLYFDMYNLWRSTLAPDGFILKPVSDFTEGEIESMKIPNLEMYT
jgi:hypothetical protein